MTPRATPGSPIRGAAKGFIAATVVLTGLWFCARAIAHYGAPPAVDTAIHTHFGYGAVGRKAVRVARCESGWRPAATSRDGRYLGLFQFDRGTWRGNTGRGDPRRATPLEQARVARVTWRRRGWQPWPECGRR